MQDLLGATLILLAACSLAAVVTAALRVPALLGYLAAGALLGPSVTGVIAPGERITGMDGAPVDDVAKLLARLDDRKVGDVVVLSVERAGKPREVRVELQPGI